MAALVALLVLRLVWMQGIQGAEYRKLAENNATRTVPLRAPRGLILDRHLRVLVDNAPARSVGLIPAELPREPRAREEAVSRLAAVLEMDPEEIRGRLARQATRPFAAVRLASNADNKKDLVVNLSGAGINPPDGG